MDEYYIEGGVNDMYFGVVIRAYDIEDAKGLVKLMFTGDVNIVTVWLDNKLIED